MADGGDFRPGTGRFTGPLEMAAWIAAAIGLSFLIGFAFGAGVVLARLALGLLQ